MSTILIVDDAQPVRAFVSATLTAAGFDVLEAADGLAALEVIKKSTEIRLVIVDLHMPRMNGFDLLAAMRAGGAAHLPSVIITTETRTELVEKGKRAGAKGWLVKPFKAENLVAVARRLTGGGGMGGTGTIVIPPDLLAASK
jgi:two-component system chemotaxis response regulator CheY